MTRSTKRRRSSSRPSKQDAWILNPSDFSFLWEECKRCFALKVKNGIRRPSKPMAAIFNRIDNEMRAHYSRLRTEDVLPMLPPGVLDTREISVLSSPLTVPGHKTKCVIRGRLDCLVRFDDGSFALVDFKTSERNAEHVPLYSRQLHAYALALENPAHEKSRLQPVTRLGLVIFAPNHFATKGADAADLSGGLSWLEFPKNEPAFRELLREILDVLDRRSLPPAAEDCPYCAYRKWARTTGL